MWNIVFTFLSLSKTCFEIEAEERDERTDLLSSYYESISAISLNCARSFCSLKCGFSSSNLNESVLDYCYSPFPLPLDLIEALEMTFLELFFGR